MANFSLVQSKTGEGDPASATFDSAVTAGNLLVVIAMERSGFDHTVSDYTISTGGATWVQHIEHGANPADTSWRRSLAVWAKVAGSSEPTTITIDEGTSNSKAILIAEYQADAVGTWNFETAFTDNSSNVNPSTFDLGPTDSVPAGDLLVLGALCHKPNAAFVTTIGSTWTSVGLTQDVEKTPPPNGRGLALASGKHTASGTYSTTIAVNNTANKWGFLAALVIYSFDSGSTQTLNFTATGGMSLAGAGTRTVAAEYIAAGGTVFGGAALRTVERQQVVSGGMTYGGVADFEFLTPVFDYTASGGMNYSGAALASFIDITAAVNRSHNKVGLSVMRMGI